MYYVYIIQSERSGKYYTGYTSNFDNRLKKHNSGGNISTKDDKPWKLVHIEYLDSRQKAWLREREIKSYKGGEAFKKIVQSTK